MFNKDDKIKWRASVGFSEGKFDAMDPEDDKRIIVRYRFFGKTDKALSIAIKKIVAVNGQPFKGAA